MKLTQGQAAELFELIQAEIDNKPMEMLNFVNGTWKEWKINANTIETLSEFVRRKCIRVKPEPEYKPFTSMESFLNSWNNCIQDKPIWVKHIKTGHLFSIQSITQDGVYLGAHKEYNWRGLFELFTFLDG